MKPTIAYLDGFNLFYGLLKGTKDLWLDPVEFVRRLIREDHDIQKVKYFSAPLKTYPYDRDAVESQNAYFQVLATCHRSASCRMRFRLVRMVMSSADRCLGNKSGFLS